MNHRTFFWFQSTLTLQFTHINQEADLSNLKWKSAHAKKHLRKIIFSYIIIIIFLKPPIFVSFSLSNTSLYSLNLKVKNTRRGEGGDSHTLCKDGTLKLIRVIRLYIYDQLRNVIRIKTPWTRNDHSEQNQFNYYNILLRGISQAEFFIRCRHRIVYTFRRCLEYYSYRYYCVCRRMLRPALFILYTVCHFRDMFTVYRISKNFFSVPYFRRVTFHLIW